jgi:putative hemolysin
MLDASRMTPAGAAPPPRADERQPHIVDRLIAERGERLMASRAWPLIRPLLDRILHYGQAVQLADAIAPLEADAAVEYIADLLALRLQVAGADNVPRQGPFILAANHPTGIADGVAVHQALKPVRPDMAIFTNRDALRVCPQLADLLIPVEWRERFRSRETLKETLRQSARAFAAGRAVVMFPSGRIAYQAGGRLTERPWQPTVVSLARKHRVPVLPVNVAARNSRLFYLFGRWNTELRDMTIFHELLNKSGQPFRVTFGPLIANDRLAGEPEAVAEALRRHVVWLADDPTAAFG